MLYIFTISAVIYTTSYTISALLFARLLQTSKSNTRLIHVFVTARLDYSSFPVGWMQCIEGVLYSGICFSLDAPPNLAMSPAICLMCSTFSPSNRGIRTEHSLGNRSFNLSEHVKLTNACNSVTAFLKLALRLPFVLQSRICPLSCRAHSKFFNLITTGKGCTKVSQMVYLFYVFFLLVMLL